MKYTNYSRFHRDIREHGIDRAIENTLYMGFDSVECIALEKNSPMLTNTSYLAKSLREHSLPVSCFSALADFSTDTDATTEYLRRCVDAAAELGSKYMHFTLVPAIALPEGAPTYDEIFPKVFCGVTRVAEHAAKCGITCLFEPQGMYFNGEGLVRFFEKIRKFAVTVGICIDVRNSCCVDCPTDYMFENLSEYIMHVHLKNFAVADAREDAEIITRGGKLIKDAPLDRGFIDIPDCLNRLKALGYDKALSIEIPGTCEEQIQALEYVKRLWNA